MKRKSGYSAWPPRWTATRLNPADKVSGEIGILEEPLMNALFDKKIFMFVNHQEVRYMGSMHFDDLAFCREVFTILKLNIGRSIKEIGDIELSHRNRVVSLYSVRKKI